MFWRYGIYDHPNNEVLVTAFTAQRLFTPRRTLDRIIKTAVIEGEIIADGQTAIEARRDEIDAVYSNEVTYAALLQHTVGDAKGDPTYEMHFPRVVSFVWLQEEHKAHFATALPFRAILESEELADSSGLLSFTQTFTKIGNGKARDVWPELDNGPAIKQTVSSHTNVTLVQSGNAAAHGGYYAFVPSPLYPNNLINPDETTSNEIVDSDVRKVYVSRWNYTMVFNADVALPAPI